MKIYITGIAGFLGANVAKLLYNLGHDVYGCDNLLTGKRANLPVEIKWVAESIQETVKRLDMPLDVVINCAAIARSAWGNDADLWEHNVNGTIAAVKLAKNSGARLIHISSSVVHVPDSSTYARTKEVAERIALASGGVALRFCNIYGPGQSEEGQEPNVIASMRRSVRVNGTVRVDGNGSQCREFIHVSDAAIAIVHAIESSPPSIWLDICSGESISILEIAKMFGRPIYWASSRNDPFEIRQDPEPAHLILNWKPLITLKDGLDEVTQLELNY